MLIKSDSLANIAPAFVKCQGAIGTALKDSTNSHFRSRYADLSAVWEAAKTALQANNLAVSQLPSTMEDGSIALTTLLIHASGEYLGATYRLKPQKEDPQGYGSALTYARRYALSALLGIVADEDDDAEAASGRTPARPAPGTVAPRVAPKVDPATKQVAPDLPVTASKVMPTFDGTRDKAIVAKICKQLNWDTSKFGATYKGFVAMAESTGIDCTEAAIKNALLAWEKENGGTFAM